MCQLIHRIRITASLNLLLVAVSAGPAVAASKVVYEQDSEFNHIAVVDTDKGERELIFGDGEAIQSATRVKHPGQLVLPYTQVAMSGLAIVPEPHRILMIGLGGGSMPMFLRRALPKATIDIAELDPVVADVAKRFFGFRADPKMQVHVGDGRAFVERTRNQYDIVFLDAFGENSIPYALATREFLLAVRKILSPDGVVVANLWSAPVNELYPSMLRTYGDVFAELHIVRVGEKSNRILLALPRREGLTKRELVRRAGALKGPGVAGLRLPALIESGYEQSPRVATGARILLDTRPAEESQPAQP
jgi:spermidine synthase